MNSSLLAFVSLILFSTSAAAQPLPEFSFHDLNGGTHALPNEWRGHSGVLILGFAHNARDTMDRWVGALGLRNSDYWLESPVVGDVSEIIRPMIRSGMRSRYDEARRAHVAPVFDDANIIRSLAMPHSGDVVVLAIDPAGQIFAHVDGGPSPSNVARLQATASHKGATNSKNSVSHEVETPPSVERPIGRP